MIDANNIPLDIIEAAEKLRIYFAEQNVQEWKLGGVQSREDGPKWIDINERRPDPDTRILMVDNEHWDDYPMVAYVDSKGRIEIEEYRDRRIASDSPDEPTFWMYVPEPPLQKMEQSPQS